VESAADRLASLYEVLVGTGWNQNKRKKQKVEVADLGGEVEGASGPRVRSVARDLGAPGFSCCASPIGD
jgi:hypothetical protein